VIDQAAGIKPGDKVQVTVTGSDKYDLFAIPATAAEAPRIEARAAV
jgi:ribosomal protein S12 methylthiotransferase